MAPRVLIVLTSHNQLGDSGKPTGWYLPELVCKITTSGSALESTTSPLIWLYRLIPTTSSRTRRPTLSSLRPKVEKPLSSAQLKLSQRWCARPDAMSFRATSPSSLEPYKDDAACQNILGEDSYRYKKTEKLSSFLGKANEFDAIFYAGGVGP